jgi:uncharacterized DUF497 family protein
MSNIRFEWDARNDDQNRIKHRIGFAEASTVFGDPLSITIPNSEHGAAEERFVIVGASFRGRLLVVVVVHTVREERIRLISARAATKAEKRAHEEGSL